jgi:Tol biopolymer transport system component
MYDCHRSQVMSVEQRGEAVRAAFRCQREGGVEVRIQLAEFDRDGLRWIAFGPAIEPGDPSGASWRSDGGLATTDNDGILSGYLLFVDADSAVRADVDFQMTQYGIWSPAADRLVFNGRRTPTLGPITAGAQTAWYLWEQPPHGPIRQLRGGLVSVSRPAWSPSGKCIVFSEGEGSRQSLTIMAASDGRTVAWARGAFGRPAWSPDGRQVAAPRTLTTDPLSTERELVLFDLPESVSDQC